MTWAYPNLRGLEGLSTVNVAKKQVSVGLGVGTKTSDANYNRWQLVTTGVSYKAAR